MHCSTFFLAALAASASAAPVFKTWIQVVTEVAPKSVSCDGADFPDECRTANQAAPRLFRSMWKNGIVSKNQQAALLSLVAFESGDFRYKRNKFPGRPGQGTSNMQMARWNLEYAKSIDALKSKVEGIGSVDGLPDSELNHILDLVVDDNYNFGSGSWFMRTQCGDAILKALDDNIDTGFQKYMECVGVTIDASRQEYFNRAKASFGL